MKKINFKLQPHHIALSIAALTTLVFSVGLVISLLQKNPSASGNLYITPKSASVSKDSEVTYTVRLSPGTPVDTVTATLHYDASKLSYKSTSYKSSPFDIQIPAIQKARSITLQSAQYNGNVTRDSLVASVVFTALENGTPEIKLTGNAAHAGVATNPTLNATAGIGTSSAAALWLTGLITSLLAGIGILIFLIIRRRRHTLHSKNHKKTQENIGKSDETA